jgi:predicted transposase YdaD
MKGEALGLEKGEAIGEQKKAVAIAKNLSKKGMSLEDISDATGLSIEQIKEIKS